VGGGVGDVDSGRGALGPRHGWLSLGFGLPGREFGEGEAGRRRVLVRWVLRARERQGDRDADLNFESEAGCPAAEAHW
jgi:hypothetical protein